MLNDRESNRPIGAIGLIALCLLASSEVVAEDLSGFDCLIEPNAVVDVSTREQGVVETILVSRGDSVKRDQPLLKLESGREILAARLARARAGMSANVESKKASLEYLQRQQKRVEDLYKKNAIAFHEKDKATTDVILMGMELRDARDQAKIAKVESERAQYFLNQRTIRSSIDGVVVEVLLDPGESVEDRPMMILAKVDPLNVEVILPIENYGMVKVGTEAEIEPQIRGAAMQRAKVTIVDRVIDAASGTFGVRLELPNSDHAIPGGIRCNIRFIQ